MALHVSATWRVRYALAWALLLLCCSEAQDSVNEGSEAVIGQSAGRCEEGSCDAKEFYLAACTIFRDEDRYLREWLSFHLCTGIEHFFLYVDRPSTQCFNDILRPYMGAGLVTLQAAHPPPNPQIPTYDHCVRHHGSRARWLAFFDVDEFLFPANRSLVVPDILRNFEDVGGLVVPWMLFGSSHHHASPPGLVIDNYILRRRLPECNGDTCAYKVIAQPAKIEACDVHNHHYVEDEYAVTETRLRLHDDASLLPTESKEGDFPIGELRLHHYKTKSYADTLKKLQREGVNAEGIEALNPKTLQGQDRWFAESDYNEEEDKSAQVWRGCVERGMRRFGERMGEAGQRCEEAAAPSVPLSKPPARERRQKPERSPQAGTDGEEDEAEGVGDGDEVNATVVTAYFEVPSKFGSEVYRHWMHNFLARVKTPMVIFTDPHNVDTIQGMRHGREHATHIIPMNLQDTLVAKYAADWREHLEWDDEKQHTVELYMIWNEKSSFLKQAAALDLFATSHLFWVDIGLFRNASDMYRFQDWPTPIGAASIPPQKILLLQVEPFSEEELELPDEGSLGVDFQYANRIGGGVFGGDKPAIGRWHEHFYATLEAYLTQQRFAGKDQSIMATVCIRTPDLCHLVPPPPHWELVTKTQTTENPWFYLQDYLLYGPSAGRTNAESGEKESV